MATVLRVRRKRSSDPSEALIFSCKKARTSGDSSGKGSASAAGAAGGGADVKTVFKFAGTVAQKDLPISQRIQAALSSVHLYASLEPPKPQAKSTPTSTTTTSSSSSSSSSKKSKKTKSKSKSKSDTKSKKRASQLAAQQEGRFQIVSTYRGVNLKGLDGQSAPSSVSNGVNRNKGAAKDNNELFSLFDAVIDDEAKSSSAYKRQTSKSDDITCNSVQMIREKLVIDDGPDSEYVYDLYYADDNQLDFGQSVVTGVQLDDEELVHDFFDEDSHEKYDDEDDSNDENNWRNDYPDEDPDKRHEDLFDEYKDEYRYGDISSDEDILNDYGDYRKRPTKNLDYFGGGRDPLDDLM